MSTLERQALAVAGNLQGLAKQQAEKNRRDIALSLYDNALEWARKAGTGKSAAALADQLQRERAALRQEEAQHYDPEELAVGSRSN